MMADFLKPCLQLVQAAIVPPAVAPNKLPVQPPAKGQAKAPPAPPKGQWPKLGDWPKSPNRPKKRVTLPVLSYLPFQLKDAQELLDLKWVEKKNARPKGTLPVGLPSPPALGGAIRSKLPTSTFPPGLQRVIKV
jgi:hypothetical protein